MTAIQATFADFKIIKTRKTAQLVMEVPIEQADEALRALGGLPRSDVEQWVGIAPLTREAAERPSKRASQRAAMLCQDDRFWAFIQDVTNHADTIKNKEDAAEWLRGWFGIKSRSEIDTNGEIAKRFDKLICSFDLWKDRMGK